MKKHLRLTFQKGDFLAILLVAALAAAVGIAFFPRYEENAQAYVQIYQDGKLIQEVPLGHNLELEIDGAYHNVIGIRDGRAAILESDCPGEDCVHSGWISSIGRSIICLPNRVEIRIAGEAEVDFVVG